VTSTIVESLIKQFINGSRHGEVLASGRAEAILQAVPPTSAKMVAGWPSMPSYLAAPVGRNRLNSAHERSCTLSAQELDHVATSAMMHLLRVQTGISRSSRS